MRDRTTSDQIIDEYLSNLRDALRTVSPTTAKEFVIEIKQHISEGRTSLLPDDEVGLRNLLERIGSPMALAHEIQETETPRSISTMERATPWLILLGGFAFGFGWLVGLYGLWSSTTWRLVDKLLGTFIWPFGLLGSFYLLSASSGSTACSGTQGSGQVSPTMTCVHHGLQTLPSGLQFLVGFVIVAAPVFTSFRLGAVLSRGYADTTNPHSNRVAKSEHSQSMAARASWIVAGLLIAVFAIFVFAVH